jgi:hypothetical protein
MLCLTIIGPHSRRTIYRGGMPVISPECWGAGNDTQTEYRRPLFVGSNVRTFSSYNKVPPFNATGFPMAEDEPTTHNIRSSVPVFLMFTSLLVLLALSLGEIL